MKNNKNQGFALIESVLIFVIVAMIGGVGWYVYSAKNNANKNLNNAAKVSTNTKTAVSKTANQTTVTAAPTASTQEPTSSAPPSASNKSTSNTTTSNISHPTISNCNGVQFTVYASVPSGTNAYGMNGGTDAGKIHYTVKYGDPITNVYCDKDSGSLVFRIDDGASGTYSEFYTKDLSLTKPQ
jgi:type II secretory pathway pseudopilin PulG